jgi:5-formyltetrahydrofolate cyclo-ligase
MAGPSDSPKRLLRTDIRRSRRALSPAQYAQEAAAFATQLRSLVEATGAHRVATYLSGPTEPSTRIFLNALLGDGLEALLPIPRHDGLMDWVLADGESEQMSDLGVPEPVGEILNPLAMDAVDLIIAPALAVDREGYRLGQGGGYYDRMLHSMARRPPVVAVVRESEIVSRVPREPTDIPVDGAVTPTSLVRFGPGFLGSRGLAR